MGDSYDFEDYSSGGDSSAVDDFSGDGEAGLAQDDSPLWKDVQDTRAVTKDDTSRASSDQKVVKNDLGDQLRDIATGTITNLAKIGSAGLTANVAKRAGFRPIQQGPIGGVIYVNGKPYLSSANGSGGGAAGSPSTPVLLGVAGLLFYLLR